MSTAYLEWSLEVECPKCGEDTDLAKNDDDNIVSGAIFNNNWDALKGHDVKCAHCGYEFALSAVEY